MDCCQWIVVTEGQSGGALGMLCWDVQLNVHLGVELCETPWITNVWFEITMTDRAYFTRKLRKPCQWPMTSYSEAARPSSHMPTTRPSILPAVKAGERWWKSDDPQHSVSSRVDHLGPWGMFTPLFRWRYLGWAVSASCPRTATKIAQMEAKLCQLQNSTETTSKSPRPLHPSLPHKPQIEPQSQLRQQNLKTKRIQGSWSVPPDESPPSLLEFRTPSALTSPPLSSATTKLSNKPKVKLLGVKIKPKDKDKPTSPKSDTWF